MDMLSYFLGRLAGGGPSGSNGPIYSDLVYNDDGSITLTDNEGQEHIMECEYVDGRLEKVKIDGNVLDAIYEEDTDKLIKLGDINIEVGDYPSEMDALETLIDESGVLEDTEGTVTEKVEELIDKAEELDAFMCIPNANGLFKSVKSFPNKTVVNLPNATNVYQCFSYWSQGSFPMVEELIVNAPNIDVSNYQACMGQMFLFNYCVKKIVLNMPDDCQHMNSTFSNTKGLEEVDLNFSTKKITVYANAFQNSTVKKIIGVLDFFSATNVTNMFNNCTNLEEATFAPNTLSISISLAQSSLLTSASIQSIVDGLATVTTAQTLTLNKAIVLTDEQKSTINAKGWTLAQ